MTQSSTTSGPGLFRFRFGRAEFDQARFTLYVEGRPLRTERRPLQVLDMLLRHAGEVVTRDELLQAVWHDRLTEPQVLKSAVTRLRGYLGPEDGRRIVAQPRVGYRFEGSLERVVVGRVLSSPLDLRAGQPVPRREEFHLQAQLGGSPRNEVWRAVAAETGQTRVFKFCADADGLSALKREVTLCALLQASLGQQAAVAEVLSTQFQAPPFYLELRDAGRDLQAWSEAGALAALTRDARLQLFLRIADAVAAAHGVGVLHKDLKPSNILLDDTHQPPSVRISDFGSGRLLQPDVLDSYGIARLGLTMDAAPSATDSGTPLYQAPEVLAGNAPTVQSDLYALGMLLYQLLLGDLRAPIAPGWERDVDDALLAADISAATARAPHDRLRSVAELCDRLRRLDARRDAARARQAAEHAARSAQESLARARARRPWVFAAFAVLAVGLASTALLYRSAVAARDEAAQQAKRAKAVNDFWTREVIDSGNPNRADGRRTATIETVLDRAAGNVGTAFADDPRSAASIYLSLGDAFVGLSAYARGSEAYADAHRLMAAALGPASPETVAVALQRVRGLLFASLIDDAEALLEETQRLAGPWDAQPARLRYAAAFARGSLHAAQQRWADAATDYAQALRLSDQVEVSAAEWFNLRGEACDADLRLGHLAEAETRLRSMLDPARADGVAPIRLAATQVQLGQILGSQGRLDDAERWLLAGHDALLRVQGPDDYSLHATKNALANLYQQRGQWSDALVFARDAADGLRRILGESHHLALVVAASHATALLYTEQTEEALRRFETLRAPLAEQLGETAAPIQAVDYFRALALARLGHVADTGALLENLEADALNAAAPSPDWALRLAALRSLGNADARAGATPQRNELHRALRDCDCAPLLLEMFDSTLSTNANALL